MSWVISIQMACLTERQFPRQVKVYVQTDCLVGRGQARGSRSPYEAGRVAETLAFAISTHAPRLPSCPDPARLCPPAVRDWAAYQVYLSALITTTFFRTSSSEYSFVKSVKILLVSRSCQSLDYGHHRHGRSARLVIDAQES